MSGGHFDYIQSRIEWEVIDRLKALIEENGKEKPDELKNDFDSEYFAEYSPETIEEFRKGLDLVQRANAYIQRIDWLVSGDDGEESFHRRLKEDLDEIEKDKQKTTEDVFRLTDALESLGFSRSGANLYEKKVKKDLWVTYWVQLNYAIGLTEPHVRIGQDVMSYEDVLFAGEINSLAELKTVFRQVGIDT